MSGAFGGTAIATLKWFRRNRGTRLRFSVGISVTDFVKVTVVEFSISFGWLSVCGRSWRH